MITARRRPHALALDLAVTAAGPFALGVAVGLGSSLSAVLIGSLSLPAVLLGVALLLVPALYIVAALTGVAPPAREMLAQTAAAMRSGSIVLLGLAPALAFLATSSADKSIAPVLAMGALGCGALLGFRDLYRRMFTDLDEHQRALSVFVAWALVASGIGAKLVLSTLVR
jgi:hypothetical protein